MDAEKKNNLMEEISSEEDIKNISVGMNYTSVIPPFLKEEEAKRKNQ
ncbi:MAG: hypothetical protein IJS28_06725 [Synergistaceae bacterium]|nr:hypothetical protein [Synergistaceae bacterium]